MSKYGAAVAQLVERYIGKVTSRKFHALNLKIQKCRGHGFDPRLWLGLTRRVLLTIMSRDRNFVET